MFDNMNSLCYKARRAAKSLMMYFLKEESKIPLFDTTKGYNNYRIYAEKVCKNNETFQKYANRLIDVLTKGQRDLNNKIARFHK